MQSIETKFVAPTNFRSARIRAKCQAKTILLPWDHSLGVEANHDYAARQLARILKWDGEWLGGSNREGTGNVYVLVSKASNAFYVDTEREEA